MKLWLRLLMVCVILTFSLLTATQGHFGRTDELPLWYWAGFMLLTVLLLWQVIWQPLDALRGRARSIVVGSFIGVFIFLMIFSDQALTPQLHWGKPLFISVFTGLFMSWIYSYGGAKRSGPERRKQL